MDFQEHPSEQQGLAEVAMASWDIEKDVNTASWSPWVPDDSLDATLSLEPPEEVNNDPLHEYKSYSSDDEVWISIDIEGHCKNQSFAQHQAGIKLSKRRICEIGLATLDTRVIREDEAGDRGVNLHKHLQCTEMAFKDIKHDKGKCRLGWCPIGNAEDFLFGQVDWMHSSRMKDFLLAKIKSLLKKDDETAELDTIQTADSDNKARIRSAVLLFFDGSQDEKWLKVAGIDLLAEFPGSRWVNIQRSPAAWAIARYQNKRDMKINAGDYLYNLGLPASGLHNAGNDATCQMQAFIAGLFLSKGQRSDLETFRKVDPPFLPRLWDSEKVIARRQTHNTFDRKQVRKSFAQFVPQVGDTSEFPSLVSKISNLSMKSAKGTNHDNTGKLEGCKTGGGQDAEKSAKPAGKRGRPSRRRDRVNIALDRSAFT